MNKPAQFGAIGYETIDYTGYGYRTYRGRCTYSDLSMYSTESHWLSANNRNRNGHYHSNANLNTIHAKQT